MYKTAEEAREAAKKFVGKRNIPPVIMERKWSKNSRKTWFGFRFFGNETFNPEWVECTDHSFERMVEVLGEKKRAAPLGGGKGAKYEKRF